MPEEYWKLVEPLWDQIRINDASEKFLRDFGNAPERPRALFAAHWTQSEAMNGGLGQFFSNPTGILAPEAVEAFRVIGMPQTSAVLLDAMAFFGDPYPRDRAKRQEVFDQFYEQEGEDAIPLLELEDQFAVLIEEENGGFWDAADRFAANDSQAANDNCDGGSSRIET